MTAAAPTQPKPVLTERQQAVLSFVQQYIATEGYPPSQANIAAAMGFTRAAASGFLRALQKKGVISITRGVARGINLKSG